VSCFADFDAVTIDGYGTLLELDDPLGHLDGELRARGVEVSRQDLARGFEAEVAYYLEHSGEAADAAGLERLYAGCAAAFVAELELDLDPADFARAFPFRFRPVPGARQTVEALARRGLALAVVANWDHNLHEQLRRHGLAGSFGAVVVSAEVGAAKPDPRPFEAALGRLGVAAARTVHVGDHANDERGAAAAGLAFRPAPLATAFEEWT
jgi:HAD superfamily hydrolase (TIGR01509 family)